MDILKYQSDFLSYLRTKKLVKEPKNLYEPIDYILQIGGKRIRPMLTLMASDIFSGDYKKAMPAALAVEVFHNFTLVHDDIMDDAPLRRGHKTVHEKWDINTGILSGDAMLILAYQYFENYEPIVFQKLAKLFSKTALEVCDGQQLDVDFETRNDVTIAEYIKMITLKTSVLVAAALKMGAIVADASEEQAQHLYNYGLNLGIAFQLQDDYLDTYGNPENFGKQVGGDIMENKKTFLYLKALEVSNTSDKEKLLQFYSKKQKNNTENNIEKVGTVSAIFTRNNIPEYTHQLIEYYTNKSFESLAYLKISQQAKDGLLMFGKNLMSRKV
ncbi:polyprenyl synthetase family protein [Tenacibaculum piscium]|uniref:Polyprenyl synthetase n=2 Tax=Tenacibaculum piscium TaxID=1458515 RepID=A0A2H1YI38_9FLAO|nr:polyprenyl synthetase family protein [Tenacibaculum piscium]MBE7629847.1 polyprenyl synthetase family protein [Tenacibaculum piscium]MBE7670259.1 polyprenyl synthetase family protein [Tenacibaculum piscium]MBE7685805.1 polyprenyl synthetase family protein [Tenacibaculum piscium]MBE7690411.1 polyprenyl synthetase family protein [Tenacibaculum piscium]SOS75143.1 Polyprenyl synthetase [Tenacibaculum piscium]